MTAIQDDIDKKMSVEDIDTLYFNLTELYRDSYHKSIQHALMFHKCTIRVFETFLERDAKDYHAIRWLLARLLEHSQKLYAWNKTSFEDNEILSKYKSPEQFLFNLWGVIKKNDKNNDLIGWLEKCFNMNSLTVKICLKRYAFATAAKIAFMGSQNRISAILSIVFNLPIIAGIAVGWLFLLQAGDAIIYFTSLLKQYEALSIVPFGVFIPLFLSGMFIYTHGERNGVPVPIASSTRIILVAWLFSWLIGIAMIYGFGVEWFNIVNKDLMLKENELNDYIVLFIPMWAAMAVFIGIFAQIIWSGRGPTEISE